MKRHVYFGNDKEFKGHYGSQLDYSCSKIQGSTATSAENKGEGQGMDPNPSQGECEFIQLDIELNLY